jgi:hypothetical protein
MHHHDCFRVADMESRLSGTRIADMGGWSALCDALLLQFIGSHSAAAPLASGIDPLGDRPNVTPRDEL